MNKEFKYLVIGIWNSLFGFVSYALSLNFLGDEFYQMSLALSYSISVVHAHATQRRFVWQSKSNYLRELSRFAVSYISIYLINAVLLLLLIEWLRQDPIITQIILIAFLTLGAYFLNRNFVFESTESR